jgi:hypothetical protein
MPAESAEVLRQFAASPRDADVIDLNRADDLRADEAMER